MKDINQIKEMLNDRCLSICEMLLPGGVKNGNEFRAGSISGEKGQSLGVHLHGNKKGIWSDFSTGESGDLIGLWCACKGVSFKDGIEQIKEYLGIKDPDFNTQPKTYTKPKKPECAKPVSDVKMYLKEWRNISYEVLERYKIGEKGNNIYFPFMDDSGLVMCKVREAKDGAKPKPTEGGCKKILFGWQGIDPNSRYIVIHEGEIDALSGASYGLPSVSVPFGGGGGDKQDWIANEWNNLARFEEIYICMDNDEPGKEAAQEIVKRLGAARCFVVTLPRKDMNECLMDGVSREEIFECLKNADTLKPEGLKHASEFFDDVDELFNPKNEEPEGYTLPFYGYAYKIRLRAGELSLWTGKTGAGKSQTLSHVIVDNIRQGAKVCIASYEMAPKRSLYRMVKQAGNLSWDSLAEEAAKPSHGYLKAIFNWWDDQLYLFDRVGKAGVAETLEIFDYAMKRFGCDVFVVDSLMRLGIGSEDYEAQEKAVYELVNWAVDNNVHIHLVAHARKGGTDQGQSKVPDLDDVKGGQEIAANAFNVFAVWRNKKHEEEIEDAKKNNPPLFEDLIHSPGVILNVAKQRNGDWTGKINLIFNKGSYQYRGTEDFKEGFKYVNYHGH